MFYRIIILEIKILCTSKSKNFFLCKKKSNNVKHLNFWYNFWLKTFLREKKSFFLLLKKKFQPKNVLIFIFTNCIFKRLYSGYIIDILNKVNVYIIRVLGSYNDFLERNDYFTMRPGDD